MKTAQILSSFFSLSFHLQISDWISTHSDLMHFQNYASQVKLRKSWRGKVLFSILFLLVKLHVFFTLNNVLKKKSQPRNIVRKSVKLWKLRKFSPHSSLFLFIYKFQIGFLLTLILHIFKTTQVRLGIKLFLLP